MRFVNSMRWLGAVAALGAAPMALAQPGDADPKDVTITVVSDPDQLNEKVNRIPLPAAGDEQSQASNKHVREVDRGKEADNSHEPAASDADGAKHDLGDPTPRDAENVKQDTTDTQHQGPDGSEGPAGS